MRLSQNQVKKPTKNGSAMLMVLCSKLQNECWYLFAKADRENWKNTGKVKGIWLSETSGNPVQVAICWSNISLSSFLLDFSLELFSFFFSCFCCCRGLWEFVLHPAHNYHFLPVTWSPPLSLRLHGNKKENCPFWKRKTQKPWRR